MDISQASYQQVKKELAATCGVELGETRMAMVASRLSRRITQLGINTIEEYLTELFSPPRDNTEWQVFIDLLTTHETYFYREANHFNFLREEVFPSFKGKPLKVLSAACSTGEEVYTLAIEIVDILGTSSNWHILGTDISTGVLDAAKEATYEEARARLVPEHLRKQYLLKGVRALQGYCQVKQDIKQHVSFEQENILQPKIAEQYDIIFCRNVLIYFSEESKKLAIENLYQRLKVGGYLFVSNTEQLRRFLSQGEMISTSIVQKNKKS